MKTTYYFLGFKVRTTRWVKPINPNPKVWKDPAKPSKAEKSLHPRAVYSMRSKAVAGHSNQCIYDSKGKLITIPPSAGTVDWVEPSKTSTKHYHHDVRPVVVANAIDLGKKDAPRMVGVLRGKVNMKVPIGKSVRAYYSVRPTWHANCPRN